MSKLNGSVAAFQGSSTGLYLNETPPVSGAAGGSLPVGSDGALLAHNGTEWVAATTQVWGGTDTFTNQGDSENVTLGNGASTTGNFSVGIGSGCAAQGDGVAIGRAAGATVEAVAIGSDSQSLGGISIGHNAQGNANPCTVIGFDASCTVQDGLAIGRNASAAPWVLNTTSPVSLEVNATASPGGAPTGIINGRLRIRVNGVSHCIALYQDE